VTPAFLESFVTTAVRLVVVLTTIEDGGCEANDTEMPVDAEVMEITDETDLAASVTEAAVMVTVAGEGTAEGAV
jgi:hypothetical protein